MCCGPARDFAGRPRAPGLRRRHCPYDCLTLAERDERSYA
eukprot:gene38382-16319_t